VAASGSCAQIYQEYYEKLLRFFKEKEDKIKEVNYQQMQVYEESLTTAKVQGLLESYSSD